MSKEKEINPVTLKVNPEDVSTIVKILGAYGYEFSLEVISKEDL